MRPVYLSPHLDDAALSCGGLIHAQALQGESPLVVTIFAGRPNYEKLSPFAAEMHARWGNPPDVVAARRAEDQAALHSLGAEWEHLNFLDGIYRTDEQGRHLYDSEAALFGPVHEADWPWIGELSEAIRRAASNPASVKLYAPLAVGNHIDHQLVQRATRLLHLTGYAVIYYEDYPYAELPGAVAEAQVHVENSDWEAWRYPVDVEAKIAAIAGYASQLDVLFGGAAPMPARVRAYAAQIANGQGYAERYWMDKL